MEALQNKYLPYILGIIALALLFILAYTSAPGTEEVKSKRARYGDTVEVRYVGYFEDGRVFDTNDQWVDLDDDDYPKSLTYVYKSEYKPLTIVIGSGQAFDEFVQNPQDVELELVGMKIRETRIITIPPARSYPYNPDLQIIVNLSERIPVYQQLTLEEFNETYGKYYDRSQGPPQVNLTLPHYKYGWNVTVIAVDRTGEVTLRNDPEEGEVNVFPWRTVVTYVDQSSVENGTIVVEMFPEVGMALKGPKYDLADPFAPKEKQAPGIVTYVGDETFIIDYNREWAGRKLTFEITLWEIK